MTELESTTDMNEMPGELAPGKPIFDPFGPHYVYLVFGFIAHQSHALLIGVFKSEKTAESEKSFRKAGGLLNPFIVKERLMP